MLNLFGNFSKMESPFKSEEFPIIFGGVDELSIAVKLKPFCILAPSKRVSLLKWQHCFLLRCQTATTLENDPWLNGKSHKEMLKDWAETISSKPTRIVNIVLLKGIWCQGSPIFCLSIIKILKPGHCSTNFQNAKKSYSRFAVRNSKKMFLTSYWFVE